VLFLCAGAAKNAKKGKSGNWGRKVKEKRFGGPSIKKLNIRGGVGESAFERFGEKIKKNNL